MNLTKSQKNIVDDLFEQYILKKNKIIDFKAPTGSGKTFMASYLISKIFNEEYNMNTMIVIATISNAELPKSFAKKIKNYKKYLFFKKFNVEYINSPSNFEKVEQIKDFKLERNKVLIFGTSSFGKNKLFSEQGTLDNFIEEAKNRNWNIIYIRDEAHRGGAKTVITKEKQYKNFDKKMIDTASFVIQMTATPKGKNNLIELTIKDLSNDSVDLIKKKSVFNDFDKNTNNSDELLDEAIKKFKKIREEYKKIPFNIRPAMLIQVDSKDKNITLEKYKEKIEKIKHKINDENLNYLKYFSGDAETNTREDKTLESASKIDSKYDVIIFKVGPATGWDIPRACMLVQIREVSSETLNIQTLGRIKRNPMPGLEFNEITNKYYVYSNYQEGKRPIKSYKLKKEFYNLELIKGKLIIKDKYKKLIEEKYVENIKKILDKSIISEYVNENSKKQKLVLNEKIIEGNHFINRQPIYVESIFDLKIRIDDFILKNKKYFSEKILCIIRKICNKWNLSFYIFIFTIRKEMDNIKKCYLNSYNFYKSKEEYILKNKTKLLQSYQIWNNFDEIEKLGLDVTKWKKYGYELVLNLKEISKNIQFFDSIPEKIFLSKVITEIEEENYKDKIKFFAKMPTLGSDIYFEYLSSKDNEVHKSYIDFALVSENKIIMVEVKSFKDYDEEKTNDLKESFKNYMINNKNNNLELVICYARKDEPEKIKIYSFDEKEKEFNENITLRKLMKKLMVF